MSGGGGGGGGGDPPVFDPHVSPPRNSSASSRKFRQWQTWINTLQGCEIIMERPRPAPSPCPTLATTARAHTVPFHAACRCGHSICARHGFRGGSFSRCVGCPARGLHRNSLSKTSNRPRAHPSSFLTRPHVDPPAAGLGHAHAGLAWHTHMFEVYRVIPADIQGLSMIISQPYTACLARRGSGRPVADPERHSYMCVAFNPCRWSLPCCRPVGLRSSPTVHTGWAASRRHPSVEARTDATSAEHARHCPRPRVPVHARSASRDQRRPAFADAHLSHPRHGPITLLRRTGVWRAAQQHGVLGKRFNQPCQRGGSDGELGMGF